MKGLFLSSLSQSINAYLRLDPHSKQRLSALHGKAITIELLPFHFIFQCCFTPEGVCLHSKEVMPAEATIRGTPWHLLGVMINKNERHRFFAEDIRIEGNVDWGQQVVDLFDNLQIDWEEHFSQFVGDVPAYHAGRFMRAMGNWFSTTQENFIQDVSDYVHEEAAWSPSAWALQDFFADVDVLRMDVDRLEARIKQLSMNLKHDEEAAK